MNVEPAARASQLARINLHKIILVYPDTFNERSNLLPPLSLIYIATPLKGNYEIKIIDQRVDKGWRETLRTELLSGNTLCLGISSMTGPQISGGIEAASIAKELTPSIPTIWGGVHPSLLPEQTIGSRFVDIAVIGDGEQTFAELVASLASGSDKRNIKGLIFKEGDSIIRTPDRSQYPIGSLGELAYDLVELENYRATPAWTEKRSLPVITSRGCPYRCAYCYNTEFCHKSWVGLSPEQAVSSIKQLSSRYDISGIFLLDDNFFVDLKRVRSICRLLIEEGLNLSIYNANCRIDSIVAMDEDLLALLKQAGFNQIFVGIESGDDEILARIKKDIRVDQIISACTKLRKAGIRPFLSFMAGFPFETTEQVKKTLGLMRLLLKNDPDAIVYKLQLYTPFPGTELYDALMKQGMEFPQSLEEWASYHYDRVNYRSFLPRHRRFLEDFHQYTSFLDYKLSTDRAGWVRVIAKIYSRLLDARIKHGIFSFCYELFPLRMGQAIRHRNVR